MVLFHTGNIDREFQTPDVIRTLLQMTNTGRLQRCSRGRGGFCDNIETFLSELGCGLDSSVSVWSFSVKAENLFII